MKLMTISAAIAAMCVIGNSAQAREHHHHHVSRFRATWHQFESFNSSRGYDNYGARQGYSDFRRRYASSEHSSYHGSLGARPAAWCGWEMRQLVGSDPGPSYNVARNWAHWGRSGPAGVGAIVVWPHHVGKIVGQEGGEWVVKSGNDGHAVRTRPRSLAGVIAIRWG